MIYQIETKWKKIRGSVGLFVWHPIILINWKNSLSHETWSNSRINKYDFLFAISKMFRLWIAWTVSIWGRLIRLSYLKTFCASNKAKNKHFFQYNIEKNIWVSEPQLAFMMVQQNFIERKSFPWKIYINFIDSLYAWNNKVFAEKKTFCLSFKIVLKALIGFSYVFNFHHFQFFWWLNFFLKTFYSLFFEQIPTRDWKA